MADINAGNLDIACVSTEVAAKFFNNGSNIQVLAINALNTLCFLANDNVSINSIRDLEGKTILTPAQGTPKLILKALLEKYNVNATISHNVGEDTVNSPDQIAPVILQNKADIILAPVHVTYNALAKPSAKHKIVLDLDSLWNSVYENPMAMGCIIARRDFIDEHPLAAKDFLNAYNTSISYMAETENNETAAQYVVDTTILPALAPAKNTLIKLKDGIRYISGEQMKDSLKQIYEVFGVNEIGGKMPDDDFYYGE
jgi:NitT/TauT family transport system substrate-binding protein